MLAAPASAQISSRDGGVAYYGHVFPVQGAHGVRGAIGEFHAPRNDGRIHEGFDVTAACGARLVAVRNGRVLRRGFDPLLYGNYLLIYGEGERRSYFYAHLSRPAAVRRGQRLWEGEPVGLVGETGNAAGTGCHLHFEIHARGVPVDPEPSLQRWDRYS
jgi:peptidoglycan LD-endopeptidase LytH